MRRLKIFILMVTLSLGMAMPATPVAAGVTIDSAKTQTKTGADGKTVQSIFRTIANILLFLIGAVAVIMLIVGGFRFVTANGDQNTISSAKNTVLYAIIGIVVAFLAFAAVNFIAVQLQPE